MYLCGLIPPAPTDGGCRGFFCSTCGLDKEKGVAAVAEFINSIMNSATSGCLRP